MVNNYWQEEFGGEYRTGLCDYINDNKIEQMLAEVEEPAVNTVRKIINKALELKGLNPKEAAVLLQVKDKTLVDEFLQAAREVKEKIYGKRLVLFAPLYFANACVNNCLYCGYRRNNQLVERRKLTQSEIKKEVEALEREGHKRLLVLTGESPETDLDYLIKGIATAYQTKTEKGGEIRRINVEIAPLSIDGFKELKKAGIGTYTCFQETYHRQTYRAMHRSGPKANYDWRLTVMDRAQQAGVDDIGIGALFGLYDYRFELIALLLHAEYLEKTYGVGPHTISVPRLNPALGTPLAAPPAPVSDHDFKKLVAILRLAVPSTGIILTTRESAEIRNELFLHGVSQISAGSRTTPGGYKDQEQTGDLAQFSLDDIRPIDEIIIEIARNGYIPSFCTACYRLGRTGQDFMELAKPGLIQQFCNPNAMLTFQEYLVDYGTKESRELGQRCLHEQLTALTGVNAKLAATVKESLEKIKHGEHDFYI